MKSRQNILTTLDLGGKVQVLHAQYHGRAFHPHWHNEYAIGLIVDGVETFEYRGGTHRATMDQAIFMDAGEVHTGEAQDERGFAFQMLYIPASSFQELSLSKSSARSTLHFSDAILSDAELAAALRRFHASVAEETPPLEQESLLLDALSLVLRRSATWTPMENFPKPPSALRHARDLLHAHLFHDVSLESLAKEAGVSKYHLLRSFRKQFGLPPHAYQLQQRIFHAKRLLELGNPSADIAASCGFVDQSHLTRTFRSLVGVTPGQYAAQFSTIRRDR